MKTCNVGAYEDCRDPMSSSKREKAGRGVVNQGCHSGWCQVFSAQARVAGSVSLGRTQSLKTLHMRAHSAHSPTPTKRHTEESHAGWFFPQSAQNYSVPSQPRPSMLTETPGVRDELTQNTSSRWVQKIHPRRTESARPKAQAAPAWLCTQLCFQSNAPVHTSCGCRADGTSIRNPSLQARVCTPCCCAATLNGTELGPGRTGSDRRAMD